MHLRVLLRLSALVLLATFPAALAQAGDPHVLDIVARGHAFELSDQEIPSGWTTIRLRNETGEPHFAVFERLPEGRTVADSLREVVPPFQRAMDLILDGRVDEGFAALGTLPEWYGDVVFSGGPGMVSPGGVAEVTTYLEPGRYVIECYVKTDEGVFHTSLGMIEEVLVTEGQSGAVPPEADLEITLTNPEPDDGTAPETGFAVEGVPTAGRRVVAVHFDEAEPPLLGNDLHLVRLRDGEDPADAAAWMDWSRPDGLTTPAPVSFLGGTHEMPRGATAYLIVDLEPGRYAWVSERPADLPMYLPFEVR